MGYITEFEGEFMLDKPLDEETIEMVDEINEYVKRRDTKELAEFLGISEIVCKEKYGKDGHKYLDTNDVATVQTDHWDWFQYKSDWMYSRENQSICWNGMEKFYYYVEWLELIIECVLAPRGYVLNGDVEYCKDGFNKVEEEEDDSDEDCDSDEERSEVRQNCVYGSDCHGWIHVFENDVSATHPVFEGSNGYYCPTCN